MSLSPELIERVVRMALDEDAPWGDITSETLIPADALVTAQLVAREDGVLCGAEIFAAAMVMCDSGIVVEFAVEDASQFSAGQTLASITGPARGVLRGERVALNFTQRLSGIATMTARYVAQTTGTKARIVDTRKTTPGLRQFERYAVRCGGGWNHRFSLSDAVMAKDNHLAIVAESGSLSLTEALLAARKRLPHTTHVEVEVDRPDQIEPVLAGGVDTIMLDNFSTDAMRDAVAQIAGRALIEASGGITLGRIREIAETGVDVISVGALTHSVRALDLGLDIAVF
ncbi:nicotinate-nucleotide pyrophosphorylase (carboxylating) [Terriglobus roseus DSM 18391]|uniref:Probable nicotinate-nucleotide pyrophosphorylase [carboxylating] n=1 Tax=Terriglobus roseus (strain DSM 18391 / NRRL B-41598 / KBS 63) TaxID=926566 RepID=I3ZF09_TERRK|nr:carboxylating nicotinate-nucleotide diphosphorylase [Terriglobus roseus]AFL87827.1 nicotinate-nucleotide pyrophosphorylase (carboxylating) [Terriglobus roseus DSM 18391]